MPGLLATLNFAKNLFWPTDANAPTLYNYDQNGFIRPAEGRIPNATEQKMIQDYNGSRADLNNFEQAALNEFMTKAFPNLPPFGGVREPVISPTIGTTPDPLVKKIIYVDPLILDLDGDGLEITPLSKGILFDANGDSIKTGTADIRVRSCKKNIVQATFRHGHATLF